MCFIVPNILFTYISIVAMFRLERSIDFFCCMMSSNDVSGVEVRMARAKKITFIFATVTLGIETTPLIRRANVILSGLTAGAGALMSKKVFLVVTCYIPIAIC